MGELEELFLLVIANLEPDAFGLSIRKYIKEECQRSISISTVHSTIHRLEKKGFLTSRYSDENPSSRGGRPKLLFKLTSAGKEAMENTRQLRNRLWGTIPSLGNS